MAKEIVIHVNGESRQAASGMTVTGLLAELGLNARRVAIEYNLQILPKANWEQTQIAEGDRFEIVQFVGGG
jgi:thiamine biosynthesis protein ThiS